MSEPAPAVEPREATVATACVLDCPDTCSLSVTTRGEDVLRIEAGPGNPVTAGFICSKVSRFGERLDHRDRLLHPMRRTGGKGEGRFERLAWDEAIGEIADRLERIRDEHGGEAILPYHYGGSNGFFSDGHLDSLLFARLGASRLDKTICAAPTGAVSEDMYGKMAGVAFPDYPEARCIVIWGANPRASNIHLVPYLREAKRRGAFIALVDPIKTLSSDLVDLHVPVRPGCDLPVALGLIHYWATEGKVDEAFCSRHTTGLSRLLEAASAWPLEKAAAEAGVPMEALLRLAREYEAASPALLRCGWGLERNRNGGQAVAAVLALPAVLGKFGLRGGGFTLSNSGAGKLDISSVFEAPPWDTRLINMTELASVLEDEGNALSPPIKGLFVFNCNPVATVPDQNGILRGLVRDDLFTVVFEQVMTDTALYADVILPATTFLEHHDLKRAYGSYVVGATRPVVPPRGEARTNASVFAAIGRRLGFDDEAFHCSEEALLAKTAAAVELDGAKVDGALLSPGSFHAYDFSGSAPVQLDTVHPATADGKIALVPDCLGEAPYRYEPVASPDYPLALLTPSTTKMVNSTFGEFNLPELHVSLSPDDAKARGIVTGERVRVYNELGEVVCLARVDAHLRPGVAHMPKGAWRKSSLNGATSTALTPAHVNEVGGGACFNDARVEIAVAARG